MILKGKQICRSGRRERYYTAIVMSYSGTMIGSFDRSTLQVFLTPNVYNSFLNTDNKL